MLLIYLRGADALPAHQGEITEGATINASPAVAAMLQRLHDLGIGLGLDDFGTGFSSLSYLKQIPITTLKIDRAFISQLSDPEANTKVVEAIIALGKAMELEVVAEGNQATLKASGARLRPVPRALT